MTPQYLKDNIPPTREPHRGRNNRNIYHNIFCNTTRYMNSFFPNAVKLWNNIGDDFHSCNSIEVFKKNITNLIRPPSKSIFSVHDPKGLKCVFQLRVGLSPLRSHKKIITLLILLPTGVTVTVHLKTHVTFYFIVNFMKRKDLI